MAQKPPGDKRGDVGVFKREDARSLIDHEDLGMAIIGEHGGILATDHTRSDDHHRLWEFLLNAENEKTSAKGEGRLLEGIVKLLQKLLR